MKIKYSLLLIIIIAIISTTIIPSSATQVPLKYQGQAHNNLERYILAQHHLNESWSQIMIKDLIHEEGFSTEIQLSKKMQFYLNIFNIYYNENQINETSIRLPCILSINGCEDN